MFHPCSPVGAAVARDNGLRRYQRAAQGDKGVGGTGAAVPMSGDGGSWVAQATPQVTPGLPGTYLWVLRWVGPMGPLSWQRCPALRPALQRSPPPPPPCLFHTQNKPGTAWQIRSFSLLTLCPASLGIRRSGHTPHCSGAPPVLPPPASPSSTPQPQLCAGLWVPPARSHPLISRPDRL